MSDIKQGILTELRSLLDFDQTGIDLKELQHPLVKEIVKTLAYVPSYYLIKNHFLGAVTINDYDIELGRYCNHRKVKYKLMHSEDDSIKKGVLHRIMVDGKLITLFHVDDQHVVFPVPLVDGYRDSEKMVDQLILVHKIVVHHFESVVDTIVEHAVSVRQENLKI